VIVILTPLNAPKQKLKQPQLKKDLPNSGDETRGKRIFGKPQQQTTLAHTCGTKDLLVIGCTSKV
jgi:hypothetical protein